MNRLQILATVIFMTACVSGKPYELPAPAEITRPPSAATRPITLPKRPELREIVFQDQAGGFLTGEGLRALTAYREAAEANTDIATLNAVQAEQIAAAFDKLAAAYQRQREISAIREDLLTQARRDRFIDGLIYKALIGLGLVAAIARQ